MQSIHKQVLEKVGYQTISVPLGAELLHVHEQRGELCVWYINPNVECVNVRPVHIRMLGTGDEFSGAPGRYLGTAHLDGGSLVLHVFET